MNGDWIFEKEFKYVAMQILDFKCAEVELDIRRLEMSDNSVLLGCYVPTIPRPTSILSGKILVSRLSDHRAAVRAIDFHSWAAPFLQSLVNWLSKE